MGTSQPAFLLDLGNVTTSVPFLPSIAAETVAPMGDR